MKEYWIEGHKLSFDKNFVKKFEDITGSFLEDCLEGFIKTGFRVWNIEDAFRAHSTEEIIHVVSEIMENDIALYSGAF